MALSINLEDHYNYTLLEVRGKVDAATSQMLDRAIEAATFEGNQHLILDCSQLFSISSEGLRVLLNTRNSLTLIHSITLCNVSRSIHSLLELTGISRFINIAKDLDEAESMLFESNTDLDRISFN
ncbi:STAS domain-containing protein [Endozoicomonas sp. 8E]|uniref:STAS domain-containing protein n=1 Tax=Endozoicomonas sp. 8E TaxID=3035692 RepID=UPI002938EAEB|nr:STAS domain-containing protein [Endozoicomonas sp. 8E]WOG29398.1 STAS domain-containing protein [Endozoicomonas sp. 8E]